MAKVILNSVSQAAPGSVGTFVEDSKEIQTGHMSIQRILQENQIDFNGPKTVRNKPGTTTINVHSSDFDFVLDKLHEEGIIFN